MNWLYKGWMFEYIRLLFKHSAHVLKHFCLHRGTVKKKKEKKKREQQPSPEYCISATFSKNRTCRLFVLDSAMCELQ